MLVIGRFSRVAVALVALAVVAGCSHDDKPAPDNTLISANEIRGAMLQAQDVGPSWTPQDPSAVDASKLVSFCGGTTPAPPVPPNGELVSTPLVDEGTTGAQTLNQFALVYTDVTQAKAGLAALQAVANGCAPSVSVPQTVTTDKSEPAYTETVTSQKLSQNGWAGFALLRHKSYEAAHPGTADTSVAVLAKRNVLLVDSYAVYRLGAAGDASSASQFTGDWERLVGTVVNGVG
jgi:hypothetical protein